MKTFGIFCFVLLLTGVALRAQTPTMTCSGDWGNNNRSRSCEVREIPAGAASKLTVDGGNNGGISIKGADRGDILVRAKVEAWGESEGAAKALGAQVVVLASGGMVSANGPSQTNGSGGWSVSYEIFVPRRTGLSLQAHNGGISISDVNGAMEFHTVNGGVSLKEVAGDVRGDTHNGGVSLKLSANRWDGAGLDVSTQNGGVSINVPEQFSAQFEASTVNGRMSVSLPNVVIPRGEKSVSVTLGSGGPAIRVKTHNGGVSVSKV